MRFLSVFSGARHSIRPLHVNLQTTYLKPYFGFLSCLNSLFHRYLCRYQPLFLHFLSCFDVLIDILLFGDAMNRVSTIFSVLVTRRIAPDYETCHGASLQSFLFTFGDVPWRVSTIISVYRRAMARLYYPSFPFSALIIYILYIDLYFIDF